MHMKLADWRTHMDMVREIGMDLGSSGVLEILQKMQVLDPKDFKDIKGPIRYRLKSAEDTKDT